MLKWAKKASQTETMDGALWPDEIGTEARGSAYAPPTQCFSLLEIRSTVISAWATSFLLMSSVRIVFFFRTRTVADPERDP